ncbi:MAG: hypothetical protein ABJN26_19270 [Stappiaceae bacterium]
MNDLKQQLLVLDGTSTAFLKQLSFRFGSEDAFATKLVSFLTEPALQNGASWLLKDYLERDGTLDRATDGAFMQQLATLKHWSAQLHALQCVPYLEIAAADKHLLESFLKKCISSENKFVRAWAYNGFYALSCQHAEYQDMVRPMLQKGLESEAASVKARIRAIMKTEKRRTSKR